MNTLKSTSRRQLQLCEECGKEARVQICEPTHRNCIRPNRRASQQGRPREALWVQHDEAQPDHCGMVNAEVVQRKIVFLPGEIYLPKPFNDGGGTEPEMVRVNRVEVSRGRELRTHPEERSEGSVTGGAREL
jgi:hypothetical protein